MQDKFEKSAKVPNNIAVQNKQIAFLIEGYKFGNASLPEVTAAVKLAEENKAEYFDSISSYDAEHIGTLLKDKKEEEHKAFLFCIYFSLINLNNLYTKIVIEKIIKENYQKYFGEMPLWLNNLNESNIENFAQELLSNPKSPVSLGNFTFYYQFFKNELYRLSDEISGRRLMDYIKERSELKTVYGLIGKLHLNMLNQIGQVISEETNYKLVRITLSGRTVDVYLYGSKHGEMAHYELLEKQVKKDGLLIPKSNPVFSRKNLLDFLFFPNFNAVTKRESLEIKTHPDTLFDTNQNTHQEKTLTELADSFDYWMRNYNHSQREDNQHLINWIAMDEGGDHIQNYNKLCQLAEELVTKSYKTNPPPSEEDFKMAIEDYKEQKKFKEETLNNNYYY